MMSIDYPVDTLHRCIAHACYKGFPEIEYEDRDWSITDKKVFVTKARPHSERDITVQAMFPQTWSSTALGFGGLGGQVMTSAYTVVIKSQYAGYLVYFGGRMAYNITRANDQFFKDIAECRMHEVKGAKEKYER
jgi:hypothetical protein